MKKLLIALSLFIFGTTLYGQIGVNKQFNKNDTTRTFTIQRPDVDSCVQRFIKVWGTPVKQTAGTVLWEHINISEIGKNITIRLTDGIFTIKKTYARYSLFTSQKDKEDKLSHLKSNATREVYITFKDVNGNNFVNNNKIQKIIKNYLIRLLKE